MLSNIQVLSILFIFMSLGACTSKEAKNKDFPPPQDLPEVPNCAADGPGCKQFNPDL